MSFSSYAALLAASASLATANCAYGTSMFPRISHADFSARDVSSASVSHVNVSSFSYDGLKGPLNWYGLNETANYACANGTIQSPVVLTSDYKVVKGSSVTWTVPDYPNGAEFENLGTNVEVVVNGTLTDKTSGISYKLAQFHFHTPAEHRVNDEFMPMEMHWVFENEAKQYAVIAFLVDLCEGIHCGNGLFDEIFNEVEQISTPGNAITTGPLKFEQFIQKFYDHDAYRYSGSLTTPPCTEKVDWLISTNPLHINLHHWQKAKKVIKFNARYTQDNLGTVNLLENIAQELPHKH